MKNPNIRAVTLDGLDELGATAIRDANAKVEAAVEGANTLANEAIDSMREVRDTFADALNVSLRMHPYTTLALAGGICFVIGAIWRR